MSSIFPAVTCYDGETVADCYRYHYLNHYAIFAGGYKGSAMSIMKSLLSKYHSKG